MKLFTPNKKFVLLIALMISCRALAGEIINAVAPVTARDFYNAGTERLAAKKYAEAERMFESSLAMQDERIQPPALYNLGHARFADGVELLKKGPDAQKALAQGNAATMDGDSAIHSAESALAGNDLSRMITAYIEGRGARHELHAAEKVVKAAMETFGQTLTKWQRAADDFKSAAELNPSDTNATHNAEVVDQNIAMLVDTLQKMQAMMDQMGEQRQQLGQLLKKLRGQIPAADAPPGAAGDDGDDDDGSGVQPDSLAGQKEGAARDGNQTPAGISPDQASQILNGLSLDGSRRLSMSDKQGGKPKDNGGRNW